MLLTSTTLDASHFERSPWNEVAPAKKAIMVVTRDTSHFEMSPLKELAASNIFPMSVTLDKVHSAIGPFGPLGQSPCGDNFRHMATELLRDALTANVDLHTVRPIDPSEPVNMEILLAFAFTQGARQSFSLKDFACQNI